MLCESRQSVEVVVPLCQAGGSTRSEDGIVSARLGKQCNSRHIYSRCIVKWMTQKHRRQHTDVTKFVETV